MSMVITAWCINSRTVQTGDTITVDYIGSTQDGTIFDTSIQSIAKKAWSWVFQEWRPYEPMTFTVGKDPMVKWFTDGVVGMYVWQTKKVTIKPEDWYWLRDPNKIAVVSIADVPNWTWLSTGDSVFDPAGQPYKIVGLSWGNLLIDTNHKLAWETMIFEITLKEIK